MDGATPVVCPADRKVLNPTLDTANNRIVLDQDSDSTADYGYDVAGNTTKDPVNSGRTFKYDGENKMVEVKNSSNVTVGLYYYDGDGKRVKKVVTGGETTIFVYDASGKMIGEYSTQLNQTPQVSYLTTDALGSPRINTDENGAVISRHDYHPFGEEIVGSGGRTQGLGYQSDDIRKQFTGYERDNESGLDFAQARYFNKDQGRYMSPDAPFMDQWESDPQSWNIYLYARNNPLNIVDPSGQAVCPIFAECYTAEDGSTRFIDPASGEEVIYIETADSGVIDESGSIKHPYGPNTMTNGEAVKQQKERREAFVWNNILGGLGHGLGKLYRGIRGVFGGKSPVQTTTTTVQPNVATVSAAPKIDMGKQGKHIVGHNNYVSGRSVLQANPQQLASRAGTGQQVGNVPVGQAGSKERVDFGEVIGNYVSPSGQSVPTTKGIIHYSNSGIHIVPAQP